MKHPKHDKILKDFEVQKQKNLEKLTDKMLKKDEKSQKLRDIKINTDFLKLF